MRNMAQKAKVKKKRSSPKRTLVMFSGGIDSTAALWHAINHPEEYGEIHVHHIHIRNLEARWRAEEIAVENILNYIRKNVAAKFTFSQSVIEVPHFGNKFMYDVEAVSYVSGYMTSRDPSITKVIIAVTKTDLDIGVDGSVMRAKRMHNAFHPEEEDHSARIKEYTHRDLTKAEVFATVPPELAALTWSCRTPHYVDGKPIECGRCKSCKSEMKGIDRPMAPGKRNFK